jgi:formylglycine-generating enzyme required for sulfatase activity
MPNDLDQFSRVVARVALSMWGVVACAGIPDDVPRDSDGIRVDTGEFDTSDEPPCGLLGESCPPGFECVEQSAPLLANGIGEWCYSNLERAVYVPGGPFWYGCNRLEQDTCPGWYPEPHQVEITTRPYAVTQSPVTVVEYAACQDAQHPGCEPVTGPGTPLGESGWESVAWFPLIAVSASWYQAKAYCEWWGKTTGRPWRLCSEAEWEKAALGGCETLTPQMQAFGLSCAEAVRKYPWGDEPSECALQFWPACAQEPPFAPDPVGFHPASASPYGVIDIMGAGEEQWVEDCFSGASIPGIPRDGSAALSECDLGSRGTDAWRVTRGFQDDRSDSTATGRGGQRPTVQSSGIMCCRDL